MGCPQCGAEIGTGAKSCEQCGARFGRVCASCGSDLVADALFCHLCGAKIPKPGDPAPERGKTGDSPTGRAEQAPGTPRQNADKPERRQVTIMFCDLVGSTALSTSLDPEDLNEVFRVFRDTSGEVMRRHGGTISSYRGDGIDVLFGYPQANEDDAEHAVRAGLEVAAAIRAVHPLPNLNLEVHVGIATGVVLLGDLIGKDTPREKAAVGGTPHLAARLQALAEPGTVLISPSTRRLIGNLFDCLDLGLKSLKGFDEPVQVWQVLGEQAVDSRFEAAHQGNEWTPLTGRAQELQMLIERWRRARGGAGQIVTLLGEPGIGKSRLSQSLRESAETGSRVLLQYYCAPRFQNTALHPVIRQMQRAAGLSRTDSAGTMLDKLEALLASTTLADRLPQVVPYFAALLSIPFDGRYPPISDTAERQKERTLGELKALVAGLASQDPVMIICEDLHWADASTLELITRLAGDLTKLPVFLLGTSRPGFVPPWAGHPHAASVELRRLDRDAATSMVSHLTGSKPLPQPILEQILQKSDGIPLFIEELTKTVLESGHLEEQAGQYTLASTFPAPTVPSTLHDSLMARLDRLSTAREIVQVGAALGREFSFDMLAAILTDSGRNLQLELDRLVEAELIYCRGIPPSATYTFKHALIQDAAYGTMLRSQRQRLHAQIAQVLQLRFPESATAEPEVLAHHLTEAAMPLEAIPFWNSAGLHAATRAAHTEAIGHFNNALGLVVQLAENVMSQQIELGLRIQLGLSLSASKGYAAPEVEAAYERARQLCHHLGDTAELFPVIRGLCTFYIVRCNLETAEGLARQCVRLGEETGRPNYRIEGYTALGYIVFYFGRLAEAIEYLSKAVDLYRANNGENLQYPSAQDPCVASLCLLSHALCLQGDWAASRKTIDQINAIVQKLGRPFEKAYAQGYLAMLQTLMANPEQAVQHARQTIAVSEEHDFKVWFGIGRVQLAAAMAALGNPAEAIQIFAEASAAFRNTGAELGSPFIYVWVGRVLRALGNFDQALATVEQGLEFSRRKGERYMDADLFRLRGELLLERGDKAAARDAFLQAVAIANEQGAHLFGLRAAMSLYQLGGEDTESAEARSYLRSTLLAIGPDGSDCPDVKLAAVALAHQPELG
jgi:class 3 adenylate cyclase/tetratricopeptide (TPR) repeat protein